ncbi:MAG: glucohydrolase, partial [Spirochaetales bacterium]|nr:glucohydrolase [Candidatus Physcosoma equi]
MDAGRNIEMDMILKKSSKDWWKDLVVYQIYPKSFCDSNGDGIGDFGGIIGKLDYVKSVGANAIWLSPVNPTPFVDNGYDISDYQDIEPLYGDMQQFDEYVRLCHEKGIFVIMDLVVNHTSDQHRWFQESKKSKDNPYADYYIWQDPVDGHEPNHWGSSFGGSSWTYSEERGQYYLHLFSAAQPDLNWKNPKVQEEIFSMIEWWLKKGVDGFRVDAISYLEKCDFSTHSDILEANGYEMPMVINSGRPGTHSLISRMRKEVWDIYDAM